MSSQFFSKLSQNYIEILNDDEYYDVKIEVGKDPNVEIFRAHMIILCYRSPYFRRTLSLNKKSNDGDLVHIKLPNISPEIFKILLTYVYGELQQFCIDCITKLPQQIFKSFDVTIFSEKSLISLIKRDDLQMREIEIWEHVLKWGLTQNPTLVSDPDIWTDNDFKVMENTLQHCLPLIRFFSLSSEEFLQKVHPYKKLLKPQLYGELFKSYLDSNAEPIKGTEEILGGYNPLVWKSHKNGDHVNDMDRALVYSNFSGPAFSSDLGLYVNGKDDLCNYNIHKCAQFRYEKKIRDTDDDFLIEDYEIFQIIKKDV
ncbi:BTB/POZ protein [Rhizophagus irregularis DAOM 181602=DAOM 197198]|nr:BTB/POZ protein [Rhizophagus irregularis DAOM 181602=DAOM 197198]